MRVQQREQREQPTNQPTYSSASSWTTLPIKVRRAQQTVRRTGRGDPKHPPSPPAASIDKAASAHDDGRERPSRVPRPHRHECLLCSPRTHNPPPESPDSAGDEFPALVALTAFVRSFIRSFPSFAHLAVDLRAVLHGRARLHQSRQHVVVCLRESPDQLFLRSPRYPQRPD